MSDWSNPRKGRGFSGSVSSSRFQIRCKQEHKESNIVAYHKPFIENIKIYAAGLQF